HTDPLRVREQEWLRELNRWLPRHLYGVPNGVEVEPRATQQREDRTWEQEREGPAPGGREQKVYPLPGGKQRGGLTSIAAAQSVVGEYTDEAAVRAEELVAAPESANRLAYLPGPLADPMRVSGNVEAQVALTFDRIAGDVTALLVDR